MKQKTLLPFVLVTSLFFFWGLSYGLLDVLNKHFQEALSINKSRSTLLQAAYFGAYFLMALPAGIFMKKFGYKKGIILGLLLYATGAFLFYPAAKSHSFEFFLFALFIIACGLTCLETAANPYITVLGPKETSEQRLNLSQSFNGVGSFLGPIIGGLLFFGVKKTSGSADLGNVQITYLIIGAIVLGVSFIFMRTELPEIIEENDATSTIVAKPLWSHSHFAWSVVAQFFYVAAQVGVGALFINYVTEYSKGISNKNASFLFSMSLILFTVGRFVGTALMKKIAPHNMLALYAAINILLCGVVITVPGDVAVIALMAIFFFMSIMFPTIFALGVKDLGPATKQGGSFIIMSIVGGALVPPVMGIISDKSTALSYIVPLVGFVFVLFFGVKGYKIKPVAA